MAPLVSLMVLAEYQISIFKKLGKISVLSGEFSAHVFLTLEEN